MRTKPRRPIIKRRRINPNNRPGPKVSPPTREALDAFNRIADSIMGVERR